MINKKIKLSLHRIKMNETKDKKEEKKIYIRMTLKIVIFGFFLNLLWEVLHSLLYDWNKEPLINDIFVYIPRITGFASALDTLWIFTFIIWASIFNRSIFWLKSPQIKDYGVFIAIGILYAILFEWMAVELNLWSYNELMPQIFGIGLTPLIQLALTGIVSLYLASKLKWITNTESK
jgi:hypothetical protein